MKQEDLKSGLLEASKELIPFTQQFITEALPVEIRYLLYSAKARESTDINSYLGPYDADQIAQILYFKGVIPESVNLKVINYDAQCTYVVVSRGRGTTDYDHFKNNPHIYPRGTPFQCFGPPIPPNAKRPDTGNPEKDYIPCEKFSLFWQRTHRVSWKVRLTSPLYFSSLYASYYKWRYPPPPGSKAAGVWKKRTLEEWLLDMLREKVRTLREMHRSRQTASRTRMLLDQLEALDPSVIANRPHVRDSTPKRDTLITAIIAEGPQAFRTVLKYSRREGWQYREDAYRIMNSLTDDLPHSLTISLSDDDTEIRWSAAKWLRDKHEGAADSLRPLVDYMRRYPEEGNVPETLERMKLDASQYFIQLILDRGAPVAARIEAARDFPAWPIPPGKMLFLEALAHDITEPETLRLTIRGLLGEHEVLPSR